MSNQTAVLVRERIGHTELSVDLFTPEQRETFEKLLAIADRNPNLQWVEGRNDHNVDFALIQGKIEPVREFALKAAFVSRLTMRPPTPPSVTVTADDTLVTAGITLIDGAGREVTMYGGSSTNECGAKNRKKPNARAFHDAVARAQTRALKIGIEALLGFAFVNLLIMELFGTYQTDGDPENAGNRKPPERRGGQKPDVEKASKRAKETGRRLHQTLKDACDSGLVDEEWRNDQWTRVMYNIDNPSVLANIETEITEELQRRREAKEQGA